MAFDAGVFLDTLDSHYAEKCRGVLCGLSDGPMIVWEDCTVLSGRYTGMKSDSLFLDLGSFRAGVGFVFDQVEGSSLHIPNLQTRVLPFTVTSLCAVARFRKAH